MPANKNALIRYKTIDNCLRNRYRRWTFDDLVEACCDAIYDMEGISKGVSVRTVQGDIQIMRSDKLGYNAPIEVYDHKFYRYADPDYSITNMPMSQNDYEVLQEAIDMLRQLEDFEQFAEMTDVVRRLQDKLAISKNQRKPIVHFDSVPDLAQSALWLHRAPADGKAVVSVVQRLVSNRICSVSLSSERIPQSLVPVRRPLVGHADFQPSVRSYRER